jgi:hypothetical protein
MYEKDIRLHVVPVMEICVCAKEDVNVSQMKCQMQEI